MSITGNKKQVAFAKKLKYFSKLKDEWQLSTDEEITILGAPKSDNNYPFEVYNFSGSTLESNIDGAHRLKCLMEPFNSIDSERDFLRTPNPTFDGLSPLVFLKSGNTFDRLISCMIR